jgi:hypothetical protein
VIGRTDGGRELTLVVEETLEPTTWLARDRLAIDALRA